jgi:hypothetical protein
MHARAAVALTVVLAGCDPQSGERGPLGSLAVVLEPDGAIAWVDVASGDSRVVVAGPGPRGSLALSFDGAAIAFAAADDFALNRFVFAVDVASENVREVFPPTGAFMPSFEWLRSGWFSYPFDAGGAWRTAIVGPGQSEARLIGTRNFARIDESPVTTAIAYMDCVVQMQGRCLLDLVIEDPDGTNRVVLATGVIGSTPRFTPDGLAVVYAAEVAGASHVMVQSISGGAADDLGAGQPSTFLDYTSVPGGLRFSPCGEEVLTYRDGALVALSLDGAGQRVISEEWVRRAAFTGSGDVVFELEINTEVPPDDTPEYEYSSFVVSPNGDIRPLRENDPTCELAHVAASGDYVAYSCADAPVHRIDGSHVVNAGGYYVLGFDKGEQGVVVADPSTTEVRYVPLDGGPPRVVSQFHSGAGGEWPPFAYAP